MKTIADILRGHSFFEGVTKEDLDFIAGCGKNIHFDEKQNVAKPGDKADEFYLIRQGKVALILEDSNHKPFIFQTVSDNEILGLCWLIPPYRWTVTAKVIEPVRAIAINGACLREKCEMDPALGYKLMKHLAKVLVAGEEAARLHLLDVYGIKKG